jgi:hypothetical protein
MIDTKLLVAAVSADPVRSFLLQEFPAGFTLWEHIKKTETADGTGKAPKTKSHAAGGHDRMDAYLYGHHGKKRFRSPGEFFPHLLWLLTDESKSYENCRCVCCCPDPLQPAETRATSAKAEKKTKTPEAVLKSPAQKSRASAKSSIDMTSSRPFVDLTMPASGAVSSSTNPQAPLPTHSAPPQPQYGPPQIFQQPRTVVQQALRTQTPTHQNIATSNPQQHPYDPLSHTTQPNEFQGQRQQSTMPFEMQPQIPQQMAYSNETAYQQFQTANMMNYGQPQHNYGLSHTDPEYEQFLAQATQGQPGYDPQLDNPDILMQQWMSEEYGQMDGHQ